jgi:Ca2+-binding EF-hand superfamily protein
MIFSKPKEFKMKRLILVSVVLGSVLMAGQNNMVPSFSDFDTNRDGKVIQEEFENTQQQRMAEKAEAGKMLKNAANAPTFADIDTNGDGSFDSVEFSAHQVKERGVKQGMGMGKGMNQGAAK